MSPRTVNELLATAIIAILGGILVCGWLMLSQVDPHDTLTMTLVRIFGRNGWPRPLPAQQLLIVLIASPGLITLCVVLVWQRVRGDVEANDSTPDK